MISDIFVSGQEVVYNGCGSTMIDILVNTFPELLDQQDWENIHLLFVHPLLTLLEKGKATKPVFLGASFCLHKLVLFLMKEHPQVLSISLGD